MSIIISSGDSSPHIKAKRRNNGYKALKGTNEALLFAEKDYFKIF